MTTRSQVRDARSDYLRKSAKRTALRSRLIYHRKKGERAYKLRKAYLRAMHAANSAKHHYLFLKNDLNKPLRLKALGVALSMLHVVEQGGNNTGPVVDKIIREGGGSIGDPWCGFGVGYWYRKAGSKSVTQAWGAAWAMLWGWVKGVKKIDEGDLLPGDVVEYEWQHTGLFVRWINKANGTFEAVEANTGTSGNTSYTTRDGIHRRTDRNLTQVKGAFRVKR